MILTYKYLLLPVKPVQQRLNDWCNGCRFLANLANEHDFSDKFLDALQQQFGVQQQQLQSALTLLTTIYHRPTAGLTVELETQIHDFLFPRKVL